MKSNSQQTTIAWPEIDEIPVDTDFRISPPQGWYAILKPTIDVLMAILLLVIFLPVMILGWVLVKLSSSGPGFYTQIRSGLGGRPYRIYKLRTMRHNIEAKTGIQWSQKGDPRITRVGEFLRKTHMDELPQLFNVICGEMSLVGPRPERPEVINGKGLANQVPGYLQRLNVKPGVTGLAQIQLPADSDIKSVRHKVTYDMFYIMNQNFGNDLRLMLATAFKAIGMKPHWLRRLFRLPSRDEVAEAILRSTNTPPPIGHNTPQYQPV